MNKRTRWWLGVAALATGLFATGCGGSGGGVDLGTLPRHYTVLMADMPSQFASVIGIDNSGVVIFSDRGKTFSTWSETSGAHPLYTSAVTYSSLIVSDDGVLAGTDQTQNAVTIDSAGPHPIVGASGPLKGTVVGFQAGKPVVRDENAMVIVGSLAPVTLEVPADEPYTTPYCTSSGQSGLLGGALMRPVAMSGGVFLFPAAARWTEAGSLKELDKPIADQYQSAVSVVLDDDTMFGTADANSSHSIAHWSVDGKIISQMDGGQLTVMQVNSASHGGFVVGLSDLVPGQGFVWTSASGLKSLALLTDALPGESQPTSVTGSYVNSKGWISVSSFVSSGAGVPADKVAILKPVP